MAPRVEVFLAPVVPHRAVAQPIISLEKQKILGYFLRLTLLRFVGTLREDVYEFLFD